MGDSKKKTKSKPSVPSPEKEALPKMDFNIDNDVPPLDEEWADPVSGPLAEPRDAPSPELPFQTAGLAPPVTMVPDSDEDADVDDDDEDRVRMQAEQWRVQAEEWRVQGGQWDVREQEHLAHEFAEHQRAYFSICDWAIHNAAVARAAAILAANPMSHMSWDSVMFISLQQVIGSLQQEPGSVAAQMLQAYSAMARVHGRLMRVAMRTAAAAARAAAADAAADAIAAAAETVTIDDEDAEVTVIFCSGDDAAAAA